MLHAQSVRKGFGSDVPQIDGTTVLFCVAVLAGVEYDGHGPLAGSLVQLVGKNRAVVAEDMSGPYRHVRSLDVCVAGGQS